MNEVGEEAGPSWASIFPEKPSPGSLGVVAPIGRLKEITELQQEATLRIWEVRGVVSDHIPLAGLGPLTTEPNHRFFLNDTLLTLHLHRGGKRVVFFDLVANNSERKLEYISVRVKTRLPSNAFLLAREPLSRLLDVCVRSVKQPLVYQRLDLVSPRDGGILAQELVLAPSPVGVRLGPLGGFDQSDLFAPHDAIVREAITNPSPYYQLLCAYRLYEGTGALRKWLRQETQRLGIDARLPSDAVIATGELEKMGLPAQVAQGIGKANDLFKKFGEARNGIAHFLFDADSGEHHMYLADGGTFQHYSVASAVLLRYARQALEDLREFYRVHLHTRRMIGSVLPTDSRDERFVVTDEP